MQLEQRKTLFLFSLTTLFLTVYLSQFSLALYIFLLFCLHSLTQFFKTTMSSHSRTLSAPNGRMTFLFISSCLSSFLPSTRLSSIHNKCKPTCLDFVRNIEKKMTSILPFWQAS